jgi:folate-binding protein YgfZ
MTRATHPGYPGARTSIALFRQHHARINLAGKDVLDFLHRMSTNDLRDLPDGGNRRTVLVNEKARIVDLVTVVRSGDAVSLIGSAGNARVLAQWLERFIIMEDVRITDELDNVGIPRLIGPGSPSVVEEGGRVPPTRAIRADLGSIPAFLLTGETDISGLPEIDEKTFETLRIEEGVPAFGTELTAEFNPLEGGLLDCISFSKGCYIGQEVIARLDTYKKLRKVLSAFEFPGYEGNTLSPGRLLHGETDAGTVTSTAYSPAQEGWIGLGYRRLNTSADTLILKPSGGAKSVPARIVSGLPETYGSYEIDAEQ